jgi:plasmid maintenance system antidote protein VapI
VEKGGLIVSKAGLLRAGNVFDEDLALATEDPQMRAMFELNYAKANAIADLLEIIDQRREEQHLTKKELAERVNRRPSAVSRLLSGNDQNPTWDTIIDLAFAVGLDLELKAKPVSPRRRSRKPITIFAAPA